MDYGNELPSYFCKMAGLKYCDKPEKIPVWEKHTQLQKP